MGVKELSRDQFQFQSFLVISLNRRLLLFHFAAVGWTYCNVSLWGFAPSSRFPYWRLEKD